MTATWPTWRHAAAQPAVNDALRQLYIDLDAEVATHQPTCQQSGRCCKFDTFDHRLYVTGLEIAWFVLHAKKQNKKQIVSLPILHIPHQDACPFQVDGLCTTHTIRPLGCRIFFCEAGTQNWQQDLYEKYLTQLKACHKQFDIAYHYMEWRTGLADALKVNPT